MVCLQDVVLGSTNITFVFSIRWGSMWQVAWGTVNALCAMVFLLQWCSNSEQRALFWTSYWTLFLSCTPDDNVQYTDRLLLLVFSGPWLGYICMCIMIKGTESVKCNFCVFRFAWMTYWVYLQIMDGSKVCEGIAPLDLCSDDAWYKLVILVEIFNTICHMQWNHLSGLSFTFLTVA